ncbi:MAG: DUF3800 domain-containing protein [bacterium]|nr:DUF3800 domain-containing protein [bacterium]
MAKVNNFIFVDESGDPGKPFLVDSSGNKTATGASPFYIISAMCFDEKTLFKMEQRIMEIKNKFGYKKEIKSNDVSLPLYGSLLAILDELSIKTYYRLIDKRTYKGVFEVDGDKKLHNIFDEYNLVKAVAYAIQGDNLDEVEVVIDRTDRRLLDGKFDSFDNYLMKKVKKYIKDKDRERINHITHVDSRYVNAMQMSDIIGGAIKDDFTKKNEGLIRLVSSKNLIKVP